MRARVVFMGTPEFAVASLKAILKSNHEVVGVVTAPDKPAGRGRKLNASAVKEAALKHNLPVLQPERLRDPDFQSELSTLEADVFVVVAFRMLPKSVWAMPKFGTFNLHASLLPNYRGAAPIHWAVINGEKETGVTTFQLDEEIDTGSIILQESTSISEDETTGELYERLMHLGAPLVVRTIDVLISEKAEFKEQDETEATRPAPKLFREHQYLHLNKSSLELHNQVRGLTPFPPPLLVMELNGERFEVKVSNSSYTHESEKERPGSMIWEDEKLIIQTGMGQLFIREIQWPGKRKMGMRDFKNGFPEHANLSSVVNP